MAPRLEEIRQRLSLRDPRLVDSRRGPQASVAMVFAGTDENLQLCLIRRTERQGDPWSGHMALPGGRFDPEDDSRRRTAEREAQEEVGLDLSGAEYLGPLDEIGLHHPLGGRLSPFAYYAGTSMPALLPEPAEVDRAFWFPTGQLWSSDRRTTTTWQVRGSEVEFPGIEVGHGIVWGLTFRVLTEFGQLIQTPLPPPLVEPVIPAR